MLKFFIKWGLLLILAILIILGLTLGGIYLWSPDKYNILIIGSDQRDPLKPGDVTVSVGRADVLMVLSIPKQKHKPLSIVMIPRDTKVIDADLGLQKINHFYVLGGRYESTVLGNLPDTREAVEQVLGIKVDATLETTFQGFEEIVELLGGVDTSAGHLDAAAAVEAVRNRYAPATGDFGRAANQREILINLISRAKKWNNFFKINDYLKQTNQVRLIYPKFRTYAFSFAFLLGHLGNFDLGEIAEVVLPGEGARIYTPAFGKGLYYWVLDETGVKEMVDEYLK